MIQDFAEFAPSAWQDDEGVLIAPPHVSVGWLGTRAPKIIGLFAIGAAFMTSLMTLPVGPVGEAEAMRPPWPSPFEASTRTPRGTVDLTPAGYWEDLAATVSEWPSLPESKDAEAEPLV